jgi:phosphoribosylanthranilate isomerase
MIVQIYEIQTPDQAQTMIDLGVDHVGSVLTSEEKWQDAEIKKAIQLVQAAGGKSSLIPLFGDIDLITRALNYYTPDIVHFCEALPALDDAKGLAKLVRCQEAIGQRFNDIEIMRSIPIGPAGFGDLVPSLQLAKQLEPSSDWFLTDTLLPPNKGPIADEQPVSGYVGITGATCDWEIARELVLQSSIPVIVAGGLGPDNVADAIAQTHPMGVDSCTQTNALDQNGDPIRFQKDPDKVRAMVERAKNHGSAQAFNATQR